MSIYSFLLNSFYRGISLELYSTKLAVILFFEGIYCHLCCTFGGLHLSWELPD